MKWLKRMVSKLIWKIAGIFPCNGKLRDGCIRRGTIFEGHEASSRMTRRGCALYKHIASSFFS